MENSLARQKPRTERGITRIVVPHRKEIPVLFKVPDSTFNSGYRWWPDSKYKKYDGSSGILVPTMSDSELQYYLEPSNLKRFWLRLNLIKKGIEQSSTLASGPGRYTEYEIRLENGLSGSGLNLKGRVVINPFSYTIPCRWSGPVGLFESRSGYKARRQRDFELEGESNQISRRLMERFDSVYEAPEKHAEIFEHLAKEYGVPLTREKNLEKQPFDENECLFYSGDGISVKLYDPQLSEMVLVANSHVNRGISLQEGRKALADMGKVVSACYNASQILAENS